MAKPAAGRVRRWTPYLAAVSLCLMLMLTINYRAFTELSRERAEQAGLSEKIENLADENLALQEEIYYLKTDPKRIESEARKIGLRPRKEKVPEPAK